METREWTMEVSKGRFKIFSLIHEMGQDLLVSIWGGSRPHIGALAAAVPRPSLKDPKKWSATSSNYTFVGHKEDVLVRNVSEKLASGLKRNVVVVAGIHWDHVTAKEIQTIEDLTLKLSDRILKMLKQKPKPNRRTGESVNG
jgi:gallate decarboxylase subunit D